MSTPVLALDHLSIVTRDLQSAADAYTDILGSTPLFGKEANGCRTAVFGTQNVHVVLSENAEAAPGLRDACFRVDDEARFRRRLARLGVGLEENAGADPLAEHRAGASPPLLRMTSQAALGLGLTFTAAAPARRAGSPGPAPPAARVTGLDHIVIASNDALATAFLFGAQLGLDLRMDRSNPDWGARLMFFRCGDLIVEVLHPLAGAEHEATSGPGDRFYGLSWRVANADAARAALDHADFDVSPVRKGRKPGTRVFTVRNRTAGVATLLLQPG